MRGGHVVGNGCEESVNQASVDGRNNNANVSSKRKRGLIIVSQSRFNEFVFPTSQVVGFQVFLEYMGEIFQVAVSLRWSVQPSRHFEYDDYWNGRNVDVKVRVQCHWLHHV